MSKSITTLAYTAAVKLAKGCYQRDILAGIARMSGADLQGKARSYAGHYATSRNNLLRRLAKAHIPHHVAVRDHGRLELVLGIW